MKRDEIKARRAAKIGLQATPINPGFISITELLARLQTAPAEPPITLTDAAEWLLFNWCNAENPPAWKCNGKLGIVPIDGFAEKHEIPLKRLEYVFHRGHFESDGPDSGASLDYDFFGFGRKEFSDFLAEQGEPLDLFCPMPKADTAPEKDTTTPATSAPVVAVVTASDGPAPLTTGDIAFCFAGLRWDEQGWKKPLGDKPKWLADCLVTNGQRGVNERRWNPVLIGGALVQQDHTNARNVRAKFQTVDLLKPWFDAWKTYEVDNLDTP